MCKDEMKKTSLLITYSEINHENKVNENEKEKQILKTRKMLILHGISLFGLVYLTALV